MITPSGRKATWAERWKEREKKYLAIHQSNRRREV
jgi:hypothetical protein